MARLLIIAVGLAALFAAPAAQAASIVFVGSDGNVQLTTPDGSRTVKVTGDASADKRYTSPTQADDGTIVVPANDKFFYILNQDGSTKSGPWLTSINSLSTSPLSAQVTPEGSTIAYGYIFSSLFCCSTYARVTFQTTSGPGSDCGSPWVCHSDYSSPRWIPGTPYAGMIALGGLDQIAVQQESGLQPWLSSGGLDFESFDVARDGSQRVLLATTPDGTAAEGAHEAGTLVLWQNSGAPPAGGNEVCSVALGDDTTDVRWSPDTRTITWDDAQGVWVSPAPTGSGTCSVSPRLIVPGAKDPDFGPKDVPGGGTTPGGTTTPGTTPGTTPPGGMVPATMPTLKLLTALRKGIKIPVTCPSECEIEASAGMDRRAAKKLRLAARQVIVARGRGFLDSGGTKTVTLKFTRKAKLRLKKARKVVLTITVTTIDGDSNIKRAKSKLTLKR